VTTAVDTSVGVPLLVRSHTRHVDVVKPLGGQIRADPADDSTVGLAAPVPDRLRRQYVVRILLDFHGQASPSRGAVGRPRRRMAASSDHAKTSTELEVKVVGHHETRTGERRTGCGCALLTIRRGHAFRSVTGTGFVALISINIGMDFVFPVGAFMRAAQIARWLAAPVFGGLKGDKMSVWHR